MGPSQVKEDSDVDGVLGSGAPAWRVCKSFKRNSGTYAAPTVLLSTGTVGMSRTEGVGATAGSLLQAAARVPGHTPRRAAQGLKTLWPHTFRPLTQLLPLPSHRPAPQTPCVTSCFLPLHPSSSPSHPPPP